MESGSETKPKTDPDQEERFLSILGGAPLLVKEALCVLEGAPSGGVRERAWCDLLIESLAGLRDVSGALDVLEWLLGRREEGPELTSIFRNAVEKCFAGGRHAMLAQAASLEGLPVSEGVRRLRLLESLAPGLYVLDGTWGFGVVRSVDDFYKKVSVDFRKKPAHSMSLSYAAESLRVAGRDHIHARFRDDPAGVKALVSGNPAELVRMAIRSYGPTPVDRIQALLTEEIMEPSAWKGFWDAARKSLRADPLVEIPLKRSEPLRLLTAARKRGAEWFAAFGSEKDPERILQACADLAADRAGAAGEERKILGNRLSYVVWTSEGRHPDRIARSALAADILGLAAEDGWDAEQALGLVSVREAFVEAVSALPVRELGPFLGWVHARNSTSAVSLMLDGLNSVPLSVVGETAGFLSQIGRGKECLDRLAGLVSGRKASVNVLAWCCRNAGHAFGNSVVGPVELALLALEATERVENGERLRSQNQIKRLLQDRTWMKSVCDLMEPSERALFLSRVKTCAGLDSVSARGVMGALVTLYPDMKQHLAGSPSGEDGAPRSARLTSWRSYRDRQEQLRDLVENQIPANSRDIAVARSYGDLRENSEYKYAREQQRLLYRRVEEFERDLKDVRGTDFDGMPSDCCGMGITVELRHPDGRMQVLHILGEWDRDEGMGIISSRSRMAECLAGRKVGDTATVPCETGNEQCIVVRISSLPEAVREWCRGRKKGDSEGVDRGRAAC